MTDLLRDTIAESIPKSLDEIVTQHRDECVLRLALNEDFAHLNPMSPVIASSRPENGTIDDWRIVAAYGKKETYLYLTGYHRNLRVPYMTSNIFSLDDNIVITKNSLYRLGTKGSGEPDVSIILNICATLHTWGAGTYLGVFHVFY